MSSSVQLELLPLGRTLTVERGMPLREALFAEGIEFPCGGHGRCKGCRIRLLEGALSVSPDEKRLLSASDLAAGWRLACRARAVGDLKIELAQWEAVILSDDSTFRFTPREGRGVAVDLGTTTLVAQLLDLRTGKVRAVRTALNVQASHGADIMTRIEFAMQGDGQARLTRLVREQVRGLISELLAATNHDEAPLREVVLVGNTVMHHLFSGLSVEPLARVPFESEHDALQVFAADALGWRLPGNPRVRFLPCLGSFVGSDILAGVLATRLHESSELAALVDLGTNGEIVIGTRDRMLCASTAAGPAFEGARISRGMRAVTGAISEVSLADGRIQCRVLGHVPPRGLCGSGLVDAVATGLALGRINASGRLTAGTELPLAANVALQQNDIRELQLAKGAIAAGLRILLQEWDARPEDLTRLHLAGAFGNYINRTSARRIGLLNFPLDKLVPSGNTALLGAKLALFGAGDEEGAFTELRRRVRHISLSENARFLEIFAEELRFPDSAETSRPPIEFQC